MKKLSSVSVVSVILLYFLYCCECTANEEENLIVSVSQGQIQGKIGVSRQERKYVKYLGIPYARKPRRFRPTQPPENWEGVRDASNYGDICIQAKPNGEKNETVGSEDCHFLNIFVYKSTTDSPSKQLLPVMVFINDDNFQTSNQSPDFYGEHYIMDEGVILVQFNHRKGVFGYLTTGKGKSILPGNLGLKDQVTALRWLQFNIHVFGGDRFRVTLFGSGSGSVAVSLHLLSSMSSGLFASAISQGGTALCPNSLVLDPKSFALKLGEYLKCPANSTDAQLEACLVNKDPGELIQFQNEMTGWANEKLIMPVGPSVEFLDDSDQVTGTEEENLFLPDFPENILRAGTFNKKIPWIVGCNSKAGFSPNFVILKRNSSYLQALNQNWEKYAPLIFDYGLTSRSPAFISRRIREFYFADDEENKINHKNIETFFSVTSDYNYFQCIRKSALLAGKFAKVYLYYFAYQQANFFQKSEIDGVGEGGELQYLFNLNPNSKQNKNTTPQLHMMRRSQTFKFSTSFIRLWISFANDGFPMKTWPNENSWLPLSESQVTGKSPLKWYQLDTETKSISEPFFPHVVEFWQKLDTNYKLNILMTQYSVKLIERRKKQRKQRLELQFSGRGLSAGQRSCVNHFPIVFIIFYFIL